MLILTAAFQSGGSSFLSRRAPQVHQHKVTLLFIKEVIFPFSVFALFSLMSHVRKKDAGVWEKEHFKVIVTANVPVLHLIQVDF